MNKPTHAAREEVRSVEDALAHYTIDGDSVQASLEILHGLLATDKLMLFSLSQRPGSNDLVVSRSAGVGYPPARWRTVFEDFMRGRGVEWGGYNAMRPEPGQRDRVLRSEQIAVISEGRSLEVERVLYARLGILGEDTMRVLLCDGPSMMAWLGFVQPERASQAQREVLERVMPAFRKRLIFERFVAEAALASGALAASLEELGGAAWVLSAGDRIAHANTAGRARFDGDPDGTRATLAACVAGNASPRFNVTALRNGGGLAGHIVIELPDPALPQGPDVGAAARRFGLTPAQARVLERVARGITNATIAAELGVAERTVEAHVTAILVKAQVPSRAALIVQVYSRHSSS